MAAKRKNPRTPYEGRMLDLLQMYDAITENFIDEFPGDDYVYRQLIKLRDIALTMVDTAEKKR